jgi:putative transcriptional regulator
MSLAPALLLSMPQLLDPNFARTVVLLCEHAAEGAFGLVVNRPSDVIAADAVSLTPPISSPNQLPLLIGGPVEPHRGWILTARRPDAVSIANWARDSICRRHRCCCGGT